MFYMNRFFLFVVILGLLVAPVFADETLSLKTGYFTLNPEGDIAVSAAGVTGTLLDVDNDLDLDDDNSFMVEAALQLGSFRLFAAYLPIRFSGDGVMSRNVNFNGETFVSGSHVESDVSLDIYEAGVTWYLVNIDDLPVRVQFGPEIAAKYIDAKVGLDDNFEGLSESESVGIPMPSVGARAKLSMADFLGVVGRVGYLNYDGNSLFDLDAQVEFSPLPLVGAFAGYRYLDVDVEESDLLIDARFSGPYVGALVRF